MGVPSAFGPVERVPGRCERLPIGERFGESRRHVYKVYPLPVHARLFGEGDVGRLGEC